MIYKVVIQSPAEDDATEYAGYIILQERDTERATIWLQELEVAISSLTEMPHRFPVIDEQRLFHIELRQFLHYSHRVIFHIDDSRQEVHVLRIYHVRRDAIEDNDIVSP